jgi:hypothetical protein
MWKRIIAAVKILAGVRPAEVSFDELDERIAEWCAIAAADRIVGSIVPAPESCEEDNRICNQVALAIIDAIRLYASHEAMHGPQCREQLEAERKRSMRATNAGDPEIPF